MGHVADPALAELERLFFELYGRALQGDPAVAPLLQGDIEHWLEANDAVSEGAGTGAAAAGVPRGRWPGRTPASGWRSSVGLLLDLLATGDRAGVNAALDVFAGPLRRLVVGGRRGRLRSGTPVGLVVAAVARGHGEGHGCPHLDPPAPVRDRGGVEPKGRAVVVDHAPRPRAGSNEATRPRCGPATGRGPPCQWTILESGISKMSVAPWSRSAG